MLEFSLVTAAIWTSTLCDRGCSFSLDLKIKYTSPLSSAALYTESRTCGFSSENFSNSCWPAGKEMPAHDTSPSIWDHVLAWEASTLKDCSISLEHGVQALSCSEHFVIQFDLAARVIFARRRSSYIWRLTECLKHWSNRSGSLSASFSVICRAVVPRIEILFAHLSDEMSYTPPPRNPLEAPEVRVKAWESIQVTFFLTDPLILLLLCTATSRFLELLPTDSQSSLKLLWS